jgi:pimeloyl-ACP methyl ester carboxylesterase
MTLPPSKTFVLVHGAWHGGWCWNKVAAILRRRGYAVFTPTQTGLGERAHLISKTITLDTFIEDVVNVFKFEDIGDAILVGHSFAGSVISGVADRIRSKVRRLVYIDSLMLTNGQRPFDLLSADVVAARRKQAEPSGGVSIPAPAASAFGIGDPALQAWVERRLTPHPLSTYASPLNLSNKVGNGLPATYIPCVDPVYSPARQSAELARNWGMTVKEISTGHDAMVTAPELLADMLDAD